MITEDFAEVGQFTKRKTQEQLPSVKAVHYFNNLFREIAEVIRRLDREHNLEVLITFLVRDEKENPRPDLLVVKHTRNGKNYFDEREIIRLSIEADGVHAETDWRKKSGAVLTLGNREEIPDDELHRLYEWICEKLEPALNKGHAVSAPLASIIRQRRELRSPTS